MADTIPFEIVVDPSLDALNATNPSLSKDGKKSSSQRSKKFGFGRDPNDESDDDGTISTAGRGHNAQNSVGASTIHTKESRFSRTSKTSKRSKGKDVSSKLANLEAQLQKKNAELQVELKRQQDRLERAQQRQREQQRQHNLLDGNNAKNIQQSEAKNLTPRSLASTAKTEAETLTPSSLANLDAVRRGSFGDPTSDQQPPPPAQSSGLNGDYGPKKRDELLPPPGGGDYGPKAPPSTTSSTGGGGQVQTPERADYGPRSASNSAVPVHQKSSSGDVVGDYGPRRGRSDGRWSRTLAARPKTPPGKAGAATNALEGSGKGVEIWRKTGPTTTAKQQQHRSLSAAERMSQAEQTGGPAKLRQSMPSKFPHSPAARSDASRGISPSRLHLSTTASPHSSRYLAGLAASSTRRLAQHERHQPLGTARPLSASSRLNLSKDSMETASEIGASSSTFTPGGSSKGSRLDPSHSSRTIVTSQTSRPLPVSSPLRLNDDDDNNDATAVADTGKIEDNDMEPMAPPSMNEQRHGAVGISSRLPVSAPLKLNDEEALNHLLGVNRTGGGEAASKREVALVSASGAFPPLLTGSSTKFSEEDRDSAAAAVMDEASLGGSSARLNALEAETPFDEADDIKAAPAVVGAVTSASAALVVSDFEDDKSVDGAENNSVHSDDVVALVGSNRSHQESVGSDRPEQDLAKEDASPTEEITSERQIFFPPEKKTPSPVHLMDEGKSSTDEEGDVVSPPRTQEKERSSASFFPPKEQTPSPVQNKDVGADGDTEERRKVMVSARAKSVPVCVDDDFDDDSSEEEEGEAAIVKEKGAPMAVVNEKGAPMPVVEEKGASVAVVKEKASPVCVDDSFDDDSSKEEFEPVEKKAAWDEQEEKSPDDEKSTPSDEKEEAKDGESVTIETRVEGGGDDDDQQRINDGAEDIPAESGAGGAGKEGAAVEADATSWMLFPQTADPSNESSATVVKEEKGQAQSESDRVVDASESFFAMTSLQDSSVPPQTLHVERDSHSPQRSTEGTPMDLATSSLKPLPPPPESGSKKRSKTSPVNLLSGCAQVLRGDRSSPDRSSPDRALDGTSSELAQRARSVQTAGFESSDNESVKTAESAKIMAVRSGYGAMKMSMAKSTEPTKSFVPTLGTPNEKNYSIRPSPRDTAVRKSSVVKGVEGMEFPIQTAGDAAAISDLEDETNNVQDKPKPGALSKFLDWHANMDWPSDAEPDVEDTNAARASPERQKQRRRRSRVKSKPVSDSVSLLTTKSQKSDGSEVQVRPAKEHHRPTQFVVPASLLSKQSRHGSLAPKRVRKHKRTSSDSVASRRSVKSVPVLGTGYSDFGSDHDDDDMSSAMASKFSVRSTRTSLRPRKAKKRESKVFKIKDLASKNAELSSGIDDLKSELRTKEQKLQDVVDQSSVTIHSLEIQLRDADEGTQQLKKQRDGEMDSRAAAVKALSSTVKALNDRYSEKAQQYAQTKKDLQTVRTRIEELEEEKKTADQRITDMTGELKTNASEIDMLREELTATNDQMEEMEQEKAKNLEKVSLLSGQVEDAQRMVSWMQDESLAKTEQIERFEDDLFCKNEEIDKLRTDVNDKLKKIVDLEVKLESANDELTSMEESHRKDIDQLQNEYERQMKVVASAAAVSHAGSEKPPRNKPGKRLSRFLRSTRNSVMSRKEGGLGNADGGGDDNASATGSTGSVGSGDGYEGTMSERNGKIDELERTVELNEETIAKLKSDLVHVSTRYKEDKYRNSAQIEKLTQENNAYAIKVQVLEKEFQRVNSDNHEDDGDGEKAVSAALEVGADVAAGFAESSPKPHSDNNNQTDLEQRVKELEEEKSVFESTISGLTSTLKRLQSVSRDTTLKAKQEVEELRQENAAQSAKMAELESDVESLCSNPRGDHATGESSDGKARGFSWVRPSNGEDIPAIESEIRDKDAKIAQLEKSTEVHEQTVASLKSELVKMRMELKAQAYRSQQQLEDLQSENAANALKVAVLEREFQEVNTVQQEKRDSHFVGTDKDDGIGDHDDNASVTSKGIVRLDASYLSDLKSSLSEKEKVIKEKDEEIFTHQAIASRVADELRREIDSLKAEQERLRTNTMNETSNMSLSSLPEDDVFLTEEDLLGMLKPSYDSDSSFSHTSGHRLRSGLSPVEEEQRVSDFLQGYGMDETEV